MGVKVVLFGVTSDFSKRLLGKIPEEMCRRGWQVHVVSSSGGPVEDAAQATVVHHDLPMKREPSIWQDFLALVAWVKLIRKIGPDTVSLGTPKAALLGLLAARLLMVPNRVYFLRGFRCETETGARRTILLLAEAITAWCSTRVIAVSPSLRRIFLDHGLATEGKVLSTFPGSSHGVDCNLFRPAEKGRGKSLDSAVLGIRVRDIPVIGFVGRYSIDKGSQELVALHKHLFQVGLDHELLIAGPIESSPEMVDALFESGRVPHILGAVQNIHEMLQACDLLVLPTHREGFPNAVLEANASGIPAITTSATGSVDSVIHRRTGLVVPLGNTTLFCLAVESLVRDRNMRVQMGENALSWVRTNFQEDVKVNEIINLHFVDLPNVALQR